MRILITLTFTTALALATSVAGAADLSTRSGSSTTFQDNSGVTGSPGVTALQLSPMYVEIQEVLDQAGKTEQLLFMELAAATEEEDVQRIIHRIERLEMDKTVAILKIQARYARLEGRWNLDYRLRTRIMEILENEVYAVKY
jgi:hypothetical protein